jgi:hypothetical protein
MLARSKPSLFVVNSGQWNSKAVSHAHASGLDYWVTRSGVVMDFNRNKGVSKKSYREGHVIEMKFDGANPAVVSYSGKAKVKTDFMPPKATHALHAASYEEVHLSEIYPGIEMRNYFDHSKPRYDMIVKPGADASKIKLAFDGQTQLSIDKAGSLVMGTKLGDMKEAGLKAFTVASNGVTTPVQAAFKILGGNKVGFDLGAYDHKSKLVIDPLIYGSLFGGDLGRDSVLAVTSTPDGGVYMTGWTESANFPVVDGYYQLNLNGTRNCFVTLFRGDAYDVLYNSYFGGSGSDEGHYIQIQTTTGLPNLWVMGTSTSINDLPLVGSSSYMPQPLTTAVLNSFLLEFTINTDGSLSPTYATWFGPELGTTSYTLNGFVISPVDQSLMIAGTINGTIASAKSVIPPVAPGSIDVFLTDMDSAGGDVVQNTYFGGEMDDSVTGLATDPQGNFVISGTVPNPSPYTPNNVPNADLAQTPTLFQTEPAPGLTLWKNAQLLQSSDLYAAKIASTNGMQIYWSGVIGGSLNDHSGGYQTNYYDGTPVISNSVATDPAGNVYIVGTSGSFNYPRTNGVFDETERRDTNVATKISADGTQIMKSTGLASGADAPPVGIAVDGAGNFTVTGLVKADMQFNYPDPTTYPNPMVPSGIVNKGSIATTPDGLSTSWNWEDSSSTSEIPTDDAWINVFDAKWQTLLYGSYIGGTGEDTISYPFVDQFGDIWVFGQHDDYFAYQVDPFTPLPLPTGTPSIKPKQVIGWSFFPTNFLTDLAFKTDHDAPGSLPTVAGGDPGATQWTFPLFYKNPTQQPPFFYYDGLLTFFERSDGYVLRFRIGQAIVKSLSFAPQTVPGGLNESVTGTVTLSQAAPAQGAQVTVTINSTNGAAQFGTAASPSYSTVVTLAPGATTGTFTITTNGVAASTPVTVEANYEGNILITTLSVVPWLQQFSLTPTSTSGGTNVTASFVLSAPAPAAGVTIKLSWPSSASGDIYSPLAPLNYQIVTIPAGTTAFNATVTTKVITTTDTVTLSAIVLDPTTSDTADPYGQPLLNAVPLTASLTLTPISVSITGLTISPATIDAAGVATGTIKLATPAPDSGLTVTVSFVGGVNDVAFFDPISTDPFPATTTVVIPANTSQGTFSIHGGTIANTTTVNVIASFNGASSPTAPLTVNAVGFTATLNPTTVSGGSSSAGVITLAAPVTVDPLSFTFNLIDPSGQNAVSPISGVTISTPGATSTTFTAQTVQVSSTTTVTVQPTLGTSTTNAFLTVKAVGIKSFTFTPSTVRSNHATTGVLVLDGPSPTTGLQVDLTFGSLGTTSSLTYFTQNLGTNVVTIPAGATTSPLIVLTARRFTRPVTAIVTASIHAPGASSASASKSATISITR